MAIFQTPKGRHTFIAAYVSDGVTTVRPCSDGVTTVRPCSDGVTTVRPCSDGVTTFRPCSDRLADRLHHDAQTTIRSTEATQNE